MYQPLIKGIVGYLVTPFDDSGIDVPVLHQMIDRLLQSGVPVSYTHLTLPTNREV